MARKGYKTIEQQMAANKRYYENNEGAILKRRIRSDKSCGKRFILSYAEEEDLVLYESYIAERRKILKKNNV